MPLFFYLIYLFMAEFLFTTISAFLYGLLGAALASFFNAQIYRLEKELSFRDLAIKPSCCEKCGKQLGIIELLPVLGWVINKGKCSKCGYEVPGIYPLTELILGSSFVFLFLSSSGLIAYFLVASVGFLALYDLQHKGFPKWIMNSLLVVGVVYFVVMVILGETALLSPTLIVAVVVAVLIVLVNFLKKSFGVGDILVILFLGLFLKWEQLIGIIWGSSLIGGLYAAPLLLTNKLSRKDRIPFVPFLWIALLLVILFEAQVVNYIDSVLALWYVVNS